MLFNKLRKSLVLFNGAVLVLFVISVVAAVWLLADKGLIIVTDKGLKKLASQVEDINKLPDLPEHIPSNSEPHEGLEQIKFILRDSTTTVTVMSSESENVEVQIREAAKKALAENKELWTSIDNHEQFMRIYSTPFNKNGQTGVVQTIANLRMIRYFMTLFITRLLLIGLIFAVIAAFIGWLLAGRALIPIKKAWQQQQEFVADASHELRTPLTVIQTNLDVVLSNPEDKIANNLKWLENAYTETQHMGRLISDLLMLAQADGGRQVHDNKPFDLSALVNEVFLQMEPMASNCNLTLKYETQPNLFLTGDKGLIRQLLMILIDNAYKYTPANGQVELKAAKIKDNIEIIVQDNGIGISKEDKERIFDRFYRVDKVRSHSMGGVGLGLSIAMWIIKSHRGTINVYSEPGKGSIFTVYLPLN